MKDGLGWSGSYCARRVTLFVDGQTDKIPKDQEEGGEELLAQRTL